MKKQLLKALSLIMAVSMLCSCAVQENVSSSAPETGSKSESSIVETTDNEETSKIETFGTTTESTETSAPETEEMPKGEMTKAPETEATPTAETTTEAINTITPEDKAFKEILLNVTPERQAGLFESGSGIISASMVLKYYGLNIDIWNLHNKLDMVDKNRRDDVTPWEYCMGNPETQDAMYYAPVIKNMINSYLKDIGITNLKAVEIIGCKPDNIYNYVSDGKPVIVLAHKMMRNIDEDGVSWTLTNGEKFVWKMEGCFWVISGVNSSEIIAINGATGLKKTIPKQKFEKSFEIYHSQAIIIE